MPIPEPLHFSVSINIHATSVVVWLHFCSGMAAIEHLYYYLRAFQAVMWIPPFFLAAPGLIYGHYRYVYGLRQEKDRKENIFSAQIKQV